ncbi:hypothetical protein [Actinomadura rudentiformis]|uniref:hypothetical protein n=1 Tax=Actinomadura rudentiformis TaxID=359158 RepID=UPI00178C3B81|nr:hypothetical protein [Actinomadura rudentiformis]
MMDEQALTRFRQRAVNALEELDDVGEVWPDQADRGFYRVELLDGSDLDVQIRPAS